MRIKQLFWLAPVLLTTCGSGLAQTTFATITGAVKDPSASAVPNADVTATEVSTNVSTSTKSNEVGNYTIAQLKDGTYTVRAEAAGFKGFVVSNVVLTARDVRRIDIDFEVGSVGASIEVHGGATLIETETARIANTKDALLLGSIPLNTRALWGFISLTPGMNQQQGGVVRFAGSRVNQNAWSMDGTSFADGVDNTATGPLLNFIESFQEAKIDLANNSAEFSSLGQVNVISKSGSNTVHGSAFDYYVSPVFRAADPFSHNRGTGIMHYPGASIGGPAFLPKIYDGRNRTFFFFSLEKITGSQKTQTLNPTVPLPAWRDGDFSGLAAAIYDPQSGQPFAGNKIPAGRINPVSKAIQDRFYPLPNYGSTTVLQTPNYRQSVSRSFDPTTFWVTRIDHRFSQKDSLFGRYTWQRNYNLPYDGNLPTIGQRYQQRNNRAATTSYTHLFGVNKVSEIRWGYSLNNNPVFPAVNGPKLVQDLGLVGLAPNLPDISGLLKIAWSGVGLTGITQPDYTNPGYRTHSQDVQEHFSWFVGRHNMKFGYNLYRLEYDDYTADPNLFGNLTFSSRFTGG
ncbi:MAG: carboxypeptidase-like regulatory domain-containing protein, partial [Acidobacteria bacterium]|nr:carboxypeptidase-like regulatory domain-containing protein [Acidobacteriota bacterium]